MRKVHEGVTTPCATRHARAGLPGGRRRPTGRLVLLVGTVVAAVGGCRSGPPTLAVVAKRPVTVADVEAVVRQETGKALSEVAPELVAAMFESFLEEEVLLAASGNPEDRQLPLPSRSIRARALLAELCPAPPEPSEAEIAARLAQEAPSGERVLLRQLILPDLATARAARQRLEAGEDFALLSKELSRAPNAAQGGAIGWVARGQLVPEFEAVIFGLREGGVSQPVASNSGWHVFQVTSRRGPGSGDGAAARARVRSELLGVAAERTRRACLRQLAARVGVVVTCQQAPFPCRNPFAEQP